MRPIYASRTSNSASDDRWQHHPSPRRQFWFVSEGEGILPRGNIHGELLKTNHETFRTIDFKNPCTHVLGEFLMACGIEPGPFGLKPEEIDSSRSGMPSNMFQ